MRRPSADRNLLTDVPGLRVGHAEDRTVWTGVTVIVGDEPMVAAVDSRGGAPGSRETALLDPANTVQAVDAVVLSGGSAFGLSAADAVSGWLAERGRGHEVRGTRVPIVPAAILFDLLNGGRKDGVDLGALHRALGREACTNAGTDFALGNAGAGYGAKAGDLKGGLGSTSARLDDGTVVGALVAVNSFGDVVMPGSDCFWAWAFEREGEMGGQSPLTARPDTALDIITRLDTATPGANTTLGVVATDAALTRVELQRIAIMAQDGLARAIRPVHTPFDGDIVFALSTGRRTLSEPRIGWIASIGALSADCLARAVARAVYLGDSLGPRPSYRDRFPHRA